MLKLTVYAYFKEEISEILIENKLGIIPYP
jgi:hypothetical protein